MIWKMLRHFCFRFRTQYIACDHRESNDLTLTKTAESKIRKLSVFFDVVVLDLFWIEHFVFYIKISSIKIYNKWDECWKFDE